MIKEMIAPFKEYIVNRRIKRKRELNERFARGILGMLEQGFMRNTAMGERIERFNEEQNLRKTHGIPFCERYLGEVFRPAFGEVMEEERGLLDGFVYCTDKLGDYHLERKFGWTGNSLDWREEVVGFDEDGAEWREDFNTTLRNLEVDPKKLYAHQDNTPRDIISRLEQRQIYSLGEKIKKNFSKVFED